MVGILDNKKIAELVIETEDSDNSYEKINPQSLATIIYEHHNDEEETPSNVQEHIDDGSIHFTREEIYRNINDLFLRPENVQGEGDIQVSYDTDTKVVTIKSTAPSIESYITRNDLKAQDATITLTPIQGTENGVYIRANIPDVSHFLVSSNIRALDDTIYVSRDRYSNNVYLKTNPINYRAGEGLKIENGVITNTAPDKVVGLIEGDNISIESNYPNFTISARNKLNVEEWIPGYPYKKGDVIIHNNGLYHCIRDSMDNAFNYEDWEVLADYRVTRVSFVVEEPTLDIDLYSVGIVKEIQDTDTFIINIGGIIPISNTYEIDGFNLHFKDGPIPANTPIEIFILSNSILNSQDPTANINDWKENVYYEVGNIVIYKNALYKCLERHPSGTNFDVSKWQLLMGYTKEVYSFNTEEETTSIEIPEIVDDKNNISINVGNTLLLNSSYTMEIKYEDEQEVGTIITFVTPIEPNTIIEVTTYTHGVLSVPMIEGPNGRKDMLLISNETGKTYEAISKENLLKKLNLYSLANTYGKNGTIVGVNDEGTDYKFYTENEISAKMGLRNTTNGFGVINREDVINKTTNNLIHFDTGSTLSEDESILMTLHHDIIKDFTAEWQRGSYKGSLLDTDYKDTDWVQPIIHQDDQELKLRVTTTSETTDREGWRAMDEFDITGNGWSSNASSASWQYANPRPIKVTKFKFINQRNGEYTTDYVQDVKLWISNDTSDDFMRKEKTYIKDFRINGEEKEVTIENPEYARVIGMDIKNVLNYGVGALHFDITATVGNVMPPNSKGYIYVISNDEGTSVDIGTSYHYQGEVLSDGTIFDITTILPEGYTKFKQIGIFQTDSESNIWDVYPLEDINKFYINRNFVNQDQLNEILNGYEATTRAIANEEATSITNSIINQITTSLNERIDSIDNIKLDKQTGPLSVYGTDTDGNQTMYNIDSFGKVDDVKVAGTSVVTNKIANLGSMAGETASDYYKKTDLANIATSGSYNDLSNKPTTLGGYGITNAYTKAEIDSMVTGAMHFKGAVASLDKLPSSGQQVGDMYNVASEGSNYAWDGSDWVRMSESIDLSKYDNHIANKNNPHNVTKAQVGLGNVNNTSDLAKPISTATQNALDTKLNKVNTKNIIYGTDGNGNQTNYNLSNLQNTVTDVKVGENSVVTSKVAKLGTMAGETATNYSTKAVADTLYAPKSTTYTKTQVDNLLAKKVSKSSTADIIYGTSKDSNGNVIEKSYTAATLATFLIDAILQKIYPVNSLYISTQAALTGGVNNCPLQTYMKNTTWELVSSGKALWTGNGTSKGANDSSTTSNANYANAKAKTTINAGLPNITGTFSALLQRTDDAKSSGAFSHTVSSGGENGDRNSANEQLNVTFNAANGGSNLYGKSTTVQPPAYVVNVWRRTK